MKPYCQHLVYTVLSHYIKELPVSSKWCGCSEVCRDSNGPGWWTVMCRRTGTRFHHLTTWGGKQDSHLQEILFCNKATNKSGGNTGSNVFQCQTLTLNKAAVILGDDMQQWYLIIAKRWYNMQIHLCRVVTVKMACKIRQSIFQELFVSVYNTAIRHLKNLQHSHQRCESHESKHFWFSTGNTWNFLHFHQEKFFSRIFLHMQREYSSQLLGSRGGCVTRTRTGRLFCKTGTVVTVANYKHAP